jgi:hypothetical protein
MTLKKSEALERARAIYNIAFPAARKEAWKFFVTKSTTEPTSLLRWLLVLQSAVSVGIAVKANDANYFLRATERLLEEATDPQA